jgi:uncharacterized membrane protein
MIRRYLDLILIFILTITVVVLRLVNVDDGIIMKLTGAVFVLFAPGYTVMSAIFKENVLEPPAKIALGIGISLAISAVGGIALYGIGASLTRTSWTVFLAMIVLGSSAVTVVQRIYNTSYLPNHVTHQLAFSEVLLLIFSVLVLAGGVYLSWRGEQNQAYVPFTEFWILPQTDDISEIEIGLHSYEQIRMVYNISVHINGREVKTWENISVQPGQEWSSTYTLPPKTTLNETVAVYLYTNDDPTKPYRWGQLHR